MDENRGGWRKFQHIRLNKKAFKRHAKNAEGATIRHAHKFIISRIDNIRSVQRHVILWLLGVGLLVALAGAQVVWFQRSYMMLGPVSGGVYAEAVRGPVTTLNPLYASSSAELAASHLLFSSLYDYDASGHIRGDLATSTYIGAGGKEYVITLRPNAKWHDGQPVTAHDVVYTVGLMKDPATRALGGLRSTWKDINVVAVDDKTVKFTLSSVNAAFPQALTFSVLPQHVLGKIPSQSLRENGFSNMPIGSGPFQMKRLQLINEAESRKVVHMAAYEKYYKGAPKLGRFQLHVFGATPNIINALRTGEVTAATDIAKEDLGSINKTLYDVSAKPLNSGVYAIFNTTQSILKDKKVRQALQTGTNTLQVRKAVSDDLQDLYLPFVNGQIEGTGLPNPPAYDTKKAAVLLDEAGWKVAAQGIRTKDGQPLKVRVVTIKDRDYERVLEALAGQWRQLGIDLETQVIDPEDPTQDFTQRTLQPRDYDVLINRLNIGADPDVYAYWHSSQANTLGRNYSNYSNPASDDALVAGLSRLELDLRGVKYKAFARQWLDDAPAIGLYQANMYYIHGKTSETITADEKIITPSERYGGVIYWTVDKGPVYKTP